MRNSPDITAFCLALLALCCVSQAADLTVHLEDPPVTGTVTFLLFNSANTFGDLRNPARIEDQPLDGREAYHIRNVPPGEYALLVYHDENSNSRIDRNFIGIPREPLGFSNNYRPKGPPIYKRAAFTLPAGTSQHFDITLIRPLGKLGRIGIGPGVIASTSPYRDYKGGIYQVIPAITYTGERLQILGPRVLCGLVGSGRFRLAATGQYRTSAYEADKSRYLAGMDDAEDTFMLGLALQSELPGGISLSAGCARDALDKIGGGDARLGLDKTFQFGILRLSPQLGINWISSQLANNDFGVPPDKAVPGRPAYAPGSALTVDAGAGLFIEITSDWLLVVNAAVELLDGAATESPIVSEDRVVRAFATVNRLF